MVKKSTKDSQEKSRLKALQRYHILDTSAEAAFDELVQLASYICGTPISLVSLIDEHRQWFKARKGLEVHETPRNQAFCAHAIERDGVMVVPDAQQDERFADNPLVTGKPDIRFYAGAPLVTKDNFKLGTLCVIDSEPRTLTNGQRQALEVLAKQVVMQLDLRLQNEELTNQVAKIEAQKSKISTLANQLEKSIKVKDRAFSILGHDLRSPLTRVSSLLSLLSPHTTTGIEQGVAKYVPSVRNSVNNAIDILDSLVAWGSAEYRGTANELKPLVLCDVAKQVEYDTAESFYEKGNVLAYQDLADVKVKANAQSLRIVLRNLATNANKYTDRGKVTISAVLKGHIYTICVSDTGTGMPQERVNKLLNWDNRFSTEGTAKEKGSGLGLLMTRDLVKSMKGKFWIQSQVSAGTQVYFSLQQAN